MEISVTIHLIAAIIVLIIGLIQLTAKKGTSSHKLLGKVWLTCMLIVCISSFWIKDLIDWFYGYGPFHILSVWVIFCVFMSYRSIKLGDIKTHKSFSVGAYLGSVGAGGGAILAPGRVLYVALFGQ